ncbi:peptidase M14 [Paenibacillus athensensis]|uniref:Peptidase M14 n=1 Tax=Paenibacillus athensensis TaxID=1967502 RepID=A0A4Y8Q9N0_9BACL|nr:M14 family metallocarboxypeptidase [Paenibacillus athensensis]MCD1259004.1 peptidase M14 [Paenibacillus athensensis]
MTAYTYERLCAEMRRLALRYPFLGFHTIGSSVLGKPIPAIRLGTGAVPVHINAACHANEWITTPLSMRFLEEASQAYASGVIWRGRALREVLADVTLWLVPMVNPDGVDLVQRGAWPGQPYSEQLLIWNGGSEDFRSWKANVRGVDLNDQFPAHWEEEQARRGREGPGERDYGGEAPLSEPEALALFRLTEALDFELVVSLHTQGQEIYWNYRDCEPPDAEISAERLAQASGYAAVKLSGSDAGYKDWFIQQFRRPGFTVEVGLGENPLPFSELPVYYEELAPLLLEALDIGRERAGRRAGTQLRRD